MKVENCKNLQSNTKHVLRNITRPIFLTFSRYEDLNFTDLFCPIVGQSGYGIGCGFKSFNSTWTFHLNKIVLFCSVRITHGAYSVVKPDFQGTAVSYKNSSKFKMVLFWPIFSRPLRWMPSFRIVNQKLHLTYFAPTSPPSTPPPSPIKETFKIRVKVSYT